MGEAEAWELEALEDDEAEEEHALKASAAAAVRAKTVCEREKLMIIIIKEGAAADSGTESHQKVTIRPNVKLPAQVVEPSSARGRGEV